VKNLFTDHSKIRKLKDISDFESLWPFASLLHDIGYMFEGSIDKIEVTNQNDLIVLGSNIVNGYFDNIFWSECGNNSTSEIKILEKKAEIFHPRIDPSSIFSVANSLRDLDNIEIVNKVTNIILKERKLPEINVPLSSDSFDIWSQNLNYLSLLWKKTNKSKLKILVHNKNPFSAMLKRIELLRKYFNDLLVKGNNKISTRIIDHGVASGLVILKCSTLFYQIVHAIEFKELEKQEKPDLAVKNFMDMIRDATGRVDWREDYDWWWLGIVWGSMAAAYHNFPLMREFWPEKYKPAKLRIEEDPLTYLGILVDVLQEWDRYSSSFDSLSQDELPLQGKDMLLGYKKDEDKNKIIVISYPDSYGKKNLSKLKKKLDLNLVNWKKIIRIEQHHVTTANEAFKKKLTSKLQSIK